MTSYRTVLFSAVAFVTAAAPAIADSVPAVFKSTAARPAIVRPADSVPAVFKSSTAPSRGRLPMDSVPAVFKKTVVAPQQNDAEQAQSIDAQDVMSMDELFRFMFGNYLPFP